MQCLNNQQHLTTFSEKKCETICDLKETYVPIRRRRHLFDTNVTLCSELQIKLYISEKLPEKKETNQDYIPKTLKELESLCQARPVYVVDDGRDGKRYGKLEVKDKQIWIYRFQLIEKPDAKLISFQQLLFNFKKSIELPKRAFIQLAPEGGEDDDIEVVIETDELSPRAKNFVLLCSDLNGASYEGFTLEGRPTSFQISSGHSPLLKGIKDNDGRTPLNEAKVYGMSEKDSWFRIQLKDLQSISLPKFGTVVAGLESLQDHQGTDLSVTTSSLVI